MNAKCQSLGNLQAWHGSVLAHEQRHEQSGNACLASGNAANQVLQELEGLTGKVGHVSRELERIWKMFYNGPLNMAFNAGISTPNSPHIWDYRYTGSWIYASLSVGTHTGTWGC